MGEAGGVGVEVIQVAAGSPPLMAKGKGMEHLVDEGWQLGKWRYCWRLIVFKWMEM